MRQVCQNVNSERCPRFSWRHCYLLNKCFYLKLPRQVLRGRTSGATELKTSALTLKPCIGVGYISKQAVVWQAMVKVWVKSTEEGEGCAEDVCQSQSQTAVMHVLRWNALGWGEACWQQGSGPSTEVSAGNEEHWTPSDKLSTRKNQLWKSRAWVWVWLIVYQLCHLSHPLTSSVST